MSFQNITIDDSQTSAGSDGQVVIYNGTWTPINGTECSDCFNNTLHASVYADQSENPPEFTLLFDRNAVALYVFFALGVSPPTPLQLQFLLDGQPAGSAVNDSSSASMQTFDESSWSPSVVEKFTFNYTVYANTSLAPTPQGSQMHNFTVRSTVEAFFDYALYTIPIEIPISSTPAQTAVYNQPSGNGTPMSVAADVPLEATTKSIDSLIASSSSSKSTTHSASSVSQIPTSSAFSTPQSLTSVTGTSTALVGSDASSASPGPQSMHSTRSVMGPIAGAIGGAVLLGLLLGLAFVLYKRRRLAQQIQTTPWKVIEDEEKGNEMDTSYDSLIRALSLPRSQHWTQSGRLIGAFRNSIHSLASSWKTGEKSTLEPPIAIASRTLAIPDPKSSQSHRRDLSEVGTVPSIYSRESWQGYQLPSMPMPSVA